MTPMGLSCDQSLRFRQQDAQLGTEERDLGVGGMGLEGKEYTEVATKNVKDLL